MRVSFNIGEIRANVSSSGGVRVGTRIGRTYISHQLVKPISSSCKKDTKEMEIGF